MTRKNGKPFFFSLSSDRREKVYLLFSVLLLILRKEEARLHCAAECEIEGGGKGGGERMLVTEGSAMVKSTS
jgi:hypothetical protein